MRTTAQIILIALCLTSSSCSDRQSDIPLTSSLPIAVDPAKVGSYPALTKSGGGYFYDEVLEYRVWIHPDGDDYYHAFPTYEQALAFSKNQKRAEQPLVLVLQREHVNEPQPGVFEHVTGDRITEWQVQWLDGTKRGTNSIVQFLEEKKKGIAQPAGGAYVSPAAGDPSAHP